MESIDCVVGTRLDSDRWAPYFHRPVLPDELSLFQNPSVSNRWVPSAP